MNIYHTNLKDDAGRTPIGADKSFVPLIATEATLIPAGRVARVSAYTVLDNEIIDALEIGLTALAVTLDECYNIRSGVTNCYSEGSEVGTTTLPKLVVLPSPETRQLPRHLFILNNTTSDFTIEANDVIGIAIILPTIIPHITGLS